MEEYFFARDPDASHIVTNTVQFTYDVAALEQQSSEDTSLCRICFKLRQTPFGEEVPICENCAVSIY